MTRVLGYPYEYVVSGRALRDVVGFARREAEFVARVVVSNVQRQENAEESQGAGRGRVTPGNQVA